MKKIMKILKKNERGLSLLELSIAIGLVGIITTTVTLLIFQIASNTARSGNHMIAVREVDEAGFWVSLYVYSAQNMTITGDSGFPLILQWNDFASNERHKVVFSLNSSGLRGKHYVNNVLNLTKTGRIPVFEVVNPDKTKTNCKVSGGSTFNLPANGKFVITGGEKPDNGRITCTNGSVSLTATTGATYSAITGGWSWNITTPGANITITAGGSGARGSWTSESKSAYAAITAGGQSATLSIAKGVIFTVTATVGTGKHAVSEPRVYRFVPKP